MVKLQFLYKHFCLERVSGMMSTLRNYNFSKLFKSATIETDIEFKILNGEEVGSVKAHQFLLSLLSPVLKKQFEHMNGGNTIEIHGPSFRSFQTLIQFLYTGDQKEIQSKKKNEI